MQCGEIEDKSLAFIERRLSENELLDFNAHLQTCQKCEEAFVMNYAIYTAIAQLERDEDFSDNYREEALGKCKAEAAKIIRHRRSVRVFRVISMVWLGVIGILIGFTTSDTFKKTHLPSGETSSFSLGYYGISEEKDPVFTAVREYNGEMISWLHGTHEEDYPESLTETAETEESTSGTEEGNGE